MIKTRREYQLLDGKSEIMYIKGNEFKLTKKLVRGDIVSIDFGVNVGKEKSGIRPAVVLSDIVTNERSENIIVAPTTAYINKINKGQTKARMLRSQFILSRKYYKQLNRTSIVQLEDIRSVSKKRINNFLGTLSEKSLKDMEQCILNTLL